jgi:hypothetical protein
VSRLTGYERSEAEQAADLISYFTFRRFRTRKRVAEMISDRPSIYENPKHFMFRVVP